MKNLQGQSDGLFMSADWSSQGSFPVLQALDDSSNAALVGSLPALGPQGAAANLQSLNLASCQFASRPVAILFPAVTSFLHTESRQCLSGLAASDSVRIQFVDM